MRSILLIILFFSFIVSYSQPGGGGGLKIENVYTKDHERINIGKDTALKLRRFIIDNVLGYYQTYKETPQNDLFIPPGNQRLYIIYKKDTMLMDFYCIIGYNANGSIDEIESIVIQQGHYKYMRNPSCFSITNSFLKSDSLILANGTVLLTNKIHSTSFPESEYYLRIGYTYGIDKTFLKK